MKIDNEAPITWLINSIDGLIGSGMIATATAISQIVAPLASAGMGIYILLMTVHYVRGAGGEPVFGVGMRVVGACITIALGLNMDNYVNIVIPIVTGLGGDLANAIGGGSDSANTLDTLVLFYLDIIEKSYRAAGGVADSVLVTYKVILVMVGLVPFVVVATLLLLVADVGSIIVASLGPLFFAALLFPATRQYFSAWVSTAFSYALIPVVVASIAAISIGISTELLSDASGSLHGATFADVFIATFGNLILLGLLKVVSSIASSLSAGGINAGSVGGVGAAASSVRNSVGGTLRDFRAISRLMPSRPLPKAKDEGGNIKQNRKPG